MKYLLYILILLYPLNSFGQELDTTVSSINATVRFFEDSRINLLIGHANPNVHNGKAHGYRIQIYNGINRAQARSIQSMFIKSHPGVATYFTYNQPHFRVRVGNFLSRKEAQNLYAELRGKYTCMIVPTIVYVNR